MASELLILGLLSMAFGYVIITVPKLFRILVAALLLFVGAVTIIANIPL